MAYLPNRVGLALGGFIGLWHLVWSVVVALGWAQPLIDFIFRLHMIEPAHTIMPFSFGKAVGLVVITTVVGYVAGTVFGLIWKATAGSCQTK